jgi:hypothetical protein
MPHTYKDIFELNVKYVEYLLAKSLFSHQYIHNISQSGADVENEIREIFRTIVPNRYRVTHGYIVSAPQQNVEPLISPQVDMIIVDSLVPHSLFVVDKKTGMEIVPIECVLAIFEIKRTLSFAVLNDENGALAHLQEIKSSVGIVKNGSERFGPGGLVFGNGLSGGNYWNPMLGIIGLDFDPNLSNEEHTHFIGNLINRMNELELDILCSFKGYLCAIRDNQNPQNFRVVNPRIPNDPINYVQLKINEQFTQASIISRFLGYILGYLYNSNGKVANVINYFFNQSLLNL